MQTFAEKKPEIEVKTLLADSIYDPTKNYQFCLEQRIALVTPLNSRKRKEAEAGFTKDQQPVGTCGHPLPFVGYDNGFLTYRCPSKTGHIKCPFGDFGEMSSFCSDSPLSLVKVYYDGEVLSDYEIMEFAVTLSFTHIPVAFFGKPELKKEAEKRFRDLIIKEKASE